MSASISIILLCHLSLLTAAFTTFLVVRTDSVFKGGTVSSGMMLVSCGIFRCEQSIDGITHTRSSLSHVCSARAFMTYAERACAISILCIITFCYVVHVLQACGKAALLPSVTRSLATWGHVAVSILAFFVALLTMVFFAATVCGHKVSSHATAGYGIFFMMALTVTELASYCLCLRCGDQGFAPPLLVHVSTSPNRSEATTPVGSDPVTPQLSECSTAQAPLASHSHYLTVNASHGSIGAPKASKTYGTASTRCASS